MYAIVKPNNEFHRVIYEDLPNGSTDYASFGVLPVNEEIPVGKQRVGWQIVDGICQPILEDADVQASSLEEPLVGLRVLGVSVEGNAGAFTATISYIQDGSRSSMYISSGEYNDFYDNWNSAQALYDYVTARLGISPVVAPEDIFKNV